MPEAVSSIFRVNASVPVVRVIEIWTSCPTTSKLVVAFELLVMVAVIVQSRPSLFEARVTDTNYILV